MQQWQYWDEISLFIFVMIFPYFLAFLLIFMNMQIMQTRYVAYLIMKWKAYVLAVFSTNFSTLRLKTAEILLILYVYPHSWNTFLMFS